jgi:hypothetical protein
MPPNAATKTVIIKLIISGDGLVKRLPEKGPAVGF